MGNIGMNGPAVDQDLTDIVRYRGELVTYGLEVYNAAQALNGLWQGDSHAAFEQTMTMLKGDLDTSDMDLMGMVGFVRNIRAGFLDLDQQGKRAFTLL